MVFCIILSLFMVVLILSPFFMLPPFRLELGSQITDLDEIQTLQNKIVAQYLIDESLFQKQKITSSEWMHRKNFLTNRFLDLSRREDVLNYNAQVGRSLPRPP
jgi:hypothetical protein